MEMVLKVPDSLAKLNPMDYEHFKGFLQAMVNRRFAGMVRYQSNRHGYHRPRKQEQYLNRLEYELDTYMGNFNDVTNDYPFVIGSVTKKVKPLPDEGNFEQLLNIAVYAYLESEAPQHPMFHFDNTVGSVTRDLIQR